ncbi:MAG: hypothetical protein ACLGQH_04915 [Acidobacteriota bacterium]
MQDQNVQGLVAAIVDKLESGLPQDDAVAHFIRSTHGELTPAELAALTADPDDPQAESLRELLLFPGPDTALALEPALAAADLSPEQTARLADALADNPPRAAAVLPGGLRLTLPLTPEQVRRFVARLAPQRTLPGDLRQLLAARFPADAPALAVAARQTGPDWTPAATAFLHSLLARLSPQGRDAPDTIRFALRFLADTPRGVPPLPALAARYSQLLAQLRRAKQQDEALAKSNYETLILSGNRLPYLHAPDIARELEQAGAVIEAITGRPAVDTGASCQDMGVAASLEQVLKVFGDQPD